MLVSVYPLASIFRRPASLVRVDQVTSNGKKVSASVERVAVCAKNALGAVSVVVSTVESTLHSRLTVWLLMRSMAFLVLEI